jgi:ATP-dependent protease HslVU (ClpYQ) peptidase subunit
MSKLWPLPITFGLTLRWAEVVSVTDGVTPVGSSPVTCTSPAALAGNVNTSAIEVISKSVKAAPIVCIFLIFFKVFLFSLNKKLGITE